MKTLEEIIDCLKDAIVEVTLGNVNREDLFTDILLIEEVGLDSLDYASIMLAGEEFVGKKLDENKINWRNVKTIRELAELLESV